MSPTSELSLKKRPLCHGRLLLPGGSHTLAVFIDSGADVSIINEELAWQLEIERVPLPQPVPANALDGLLLGTVTHQTIPVQMLLSDNHHETITFHVLDSPRIPLILGYPWLRRHNPHIDWATGAILGWSSACHQVCLKQAFAPQSMPCTTSAPDLMGVPPAYHDFREVFSKVKATSLPPHRPYDCAIDLLPSTSPPRGRLLPVCTREEGHGGLHKRLPGGGHHPSLLVPCWSRVLFRPEEGQIVEAGSRCRASTTEASMT